MPFLQRPGDLALQAAQGNAATLRARGVTPSLTLQFHAGEITHRQMLAAARRSPNFVGVPVKPVAAPVVAVRPLKNVRTSERVLGSSPFSQDRALARRLRRPAATSREQVLFEGNLEGTIIRVTATPPGGV